MDRGEHRIIEVYMIFIQIDLRSQNIDPIYSYKN
jgi:hypothetical protein